MSSDYDIVIVGSGAAGLCAALAAAQLGSTVLVLEAGTEVGGSSKLSGGMIMGTGTRLQRDSGINDSPQSLYRDYMFLNQYKVEPVLVERLSTEVGPAIDWLADNGVTFRPEPVFSGEESVERSHIPEGAGAGIIEVLHMRLKEQDLVDIALDQRVDRLLVEDGKVAGVAVGSDEVRARSVIIATGGFGANKELLAEHYPDATRADDWTFYVGSPGAQGDAFALGSQVDALVTGHNRGLLCLRANFNHDLEVYFPGWLVIVNGHGHRFFDETTSYSATQAILLGQEGPFFAIFDQNALHAAQRRTAGGAKKLNIDTGRLVFDWVEDNLENMIKIGKVVGAPTIGELAGLVGLTPDNLSGSIDRYNDDVRAGRDSLYLKNPSVMRTVDTAPFYATELRLSMLPLTSKGLRIDENARVLNNRTFPIPGLYAAGECTGGVLGEVYMGSGNSWANCISFGRVAGRNAAKDAASARAAEA